MKAMFGLLIVSLLMATGSTMREEDLTAAIEKADFVGYGVSYQDNEFATSNHIRATEVMKGYWTYMTAKRFDLKMNLKTEYLVLVTLRDSDAAQFQYPLKKKSELSEAELKILESIPCYSEELEKNAGACERDLSMQVCGCDQKTYYNTCEMNNRGIVKFKPGKCLKD